MRTSSKMGLRIWDSLKDLFDHEQFADNLAKIDAHDHTNGRGVLIPTEGISLEAITMALLDPGVVARMFSPTISYGGAGTLDPEKPHTPGARNVLVLATFGAKSSTEKVKWEIKVNEVVVTIPQVSKSTDNTYLPVLFPVPAEQSWEWTEVEGKMAATPSFIEVTL